VWVAAGLAGVAAGLGFASVRGLAAGRAREAAAAAVADSARVARAEAQALRVENDSLRRVLARLRADSVPAALPLRVPPGRRVPIRPRGRRPLATP
jgi:hypothetical protein